MVAIFCNYGCNHQRVFRAVTLLVIFLVIGSVQAQELPYRLIVGNRQLTFNPLLSTGQEGFIMEGMINVYPANKQGYGLTIRRPESKDFLNLGEVSLYSVANGLVLENAFFQTGVDGNLRTQNLGFQAMVADFRKYFRIDYQELVGLSYYGDESDEYDIIRQAAARNFLTLDVCYPITESLQAKGAYSFGSYESEEDQIVSSNRGQGYMASVAYEFTGPISTLQNQVEYTVYRWTWDKDPNLCPLKKVFYSNRIDKEITELKNLGGDLNLLTYHGLYEHTEDLEGFVTVRLLTTDDTEIKEYKVGVRKIIPEITGLGVEASLSNYPGIYRHQEEDFGFTIAVFYTGAIRW